MDVCCLSGPGGLCVAAAGKWAVCLWSQTSSSDWSLTHTWTFSEVSQWPFSKQHTFFEMQYAVCKMKTTPQSAASEIPGWSAT